jgi:hypothetical protein
MDAIVVLLTLLLLAAVIAVVSGPLREHRRRRPASEHELRRTELEAAREAKYREIRDAELDFRTGKLSEGDYQAVDRSLRAEAMAILRELDALGAGEDAGGGPESSN